MTQFFKADKITKSFPGVVANDEVSFDLAEGEIHALLGENGSGKSTLVRTIYGLSRPDHGSMHLRGKVYQPSSPRDAQAAGVAMVFQHFSLFDALSVAENIALGMASPPPRRRLANLIGSVGERFQLTIEPDRRVGDLSVGERQRVEVIRCLLQEPGLLIMDEPTSVLTPQEVELLFATLRKLSEEGTAILYISHKLEEIRELCDRATILRAGKVVETCTPRERTARELAVMMVGSSFRLPARNEEARKGETVLEVRGLGMHSVTTFGTRLKDIGFSVPAGTILGIAGVAGNGQEELASTLSGEARPSEGNIEVQGTSLERASPNLRRKHGFLSAPEERLGHAAAPEMTLTENAFLSGAIRKRLHAGGIIDWSATRTFAKDIIEKFDVRTPGPDCSANSLSGGNLQKFVIGREILQDPRVLVVSQPTWGVDAAAAATIRQALLDLAASGTAVVVISQDLDELFEISTEVCVLNGGRLTKPRPVKGVTREELGLLMGEGHDVRSVANDTDVSA